MTRDDSSAMYVLAEADVMPDMSLMLDPSSLPRWGTAKKDSKKYIVELNFINDSFSDIFTDDQKSKFKHNEQNLLDIKNLAIEFYNTLCDVNFNIEKPDFW